MKVKGWKESQKRFIKEGLKRKESYRKRGKERGKRGKEGRKGTYNKQVKE